jgi:hypothetical protein
MRHHVNRQRFRNWRNFVDQEQEPSLLTEVTDLTSQEDASQEKEQIQERPGMGGAMGKNSRSDNRFIDPLAGEIGDGECTQVRQRGRKFEGESQDTSWRGFEADLAARVFISGPDHKAVGEGIGRWCIGCGMPLHTVLLVRSPIGAIGKKKNLGANLCPWDGDRLHDVNMGEDLQLSGSGQVRRYPSTDQRER